MKADLTNFNRKIKAIEDYLQNDLVHDIGVQSVNHFKDSFQNEGFTDENLSKWQKVKRTDGNSKWYGFQYKSNSRGRRNFSTAAASRPILSGETQNLMNSIRYTGTGRKIIITSNTPYSKIHNEGGAMKVFGKGNAIMPKRQFMGDSKQLRRVIEQVVRNRFNRILQ